jgi:multiple antibiotic resistance protein
MSPIFSASSHPGFTQFLEFFLPLFVAIDPIGLVPVFLGVTSNLTDLQRRRVTFQAVFAAILIALVFMVLGQWIFRYLAITEADFRIAGGILLLVLAVIDLLSTGKPAVHEAEIVGVVPLAMPLIAGPATLTTVLVLATREGGSYGFTAFCLVINFLVLLIVMLLANRIAQWIGANALRAFSKLVMVLLAAIAVNFIRTGVISIVGAASTDRSVLVR